MQLCIFIVFDVCILLTSPAPSGPPLVVSGTSFSPHSISLTWSPPSYTDHNGVITGYVINVTHTDTLVTLQHTSGNDTSATIQSLNPFTAYICVVAAQTGAGTGPFSTGIGVKTQEDGKFDYTCKVCL